MNKQHPVIVVGGGLSGLSLGYALQQQGVPYRVLEASGRPGGVIKSLHVAGFELDAGPNSIAMSPALRAYFEGLGLGELLVEASAAGKHRFLVRNNKVHAISPHPFKIISSRFLSGAAKWRLFTEIFRKRGAANTEETVADFVTRRFGKEIATYVFDPVLSGIYAGNVDRLSIQEVMPMLSDWEKQYGSVIKGMMKSKGMGGRKIVTMKGGNGLLADRLGALLGKDLQLNNKVTGVWLAEDGSYELSVSINGLVSTLKASQVVFAAPAYATAYAIETLDYSLAAALRQIEYPAMGVLHLGYDKNELPAIPDGFGFLVPSAEQKHFLGLIYNSAIFPFKAPEGKVLFTVFIGGAQQQEVLQQPAEMLQQQVIAEVNALLGIKVQPVMKNFQVWEKAIPQLNVGYAEVRNKVARFEAGHPGLYVAGNYVQGVSVPNIISSAEKLAGRIRDAQ
ncbi:oxygen-dependent protoporphyrinogen oxidase [Chitinophaga costaii]|uniref:Coproporphyrinogen III oxidase n=1 Tax=Chitinophaga costaii TaxID=1335309 RepID=A0A1C4D5D8_9BACT|nr:protoporphyrinogen oxidase [Chitinophaga costaii]PUZ24462.1 protoporphyrinogen oxidase [Chitinophaga costaii]SCC26553.1 oxygen-dependent protoporphyrinogen oxidase [Chitinophaga costaii]